MDNSNLNFKQYYQQLTKPQKIEMLETSKGFRTIENQLRQLEHGFSVTSEYRQLIQARQLLLAYKEIGTKRTKTDINLNGEATQRQFIKDVEALQEAYKKQKAIQKIKIWERNQYTIKTVKTRDELQEILTAWQGNGYEYITVKMLRSVLHKDRKILNKWLGQLFKKGFFKRKVVMSPSKYYF